MLRSLQIFWLLVVVCGIAYPQSPEQATVTFILDFPGSRPSHYLVEVQADGKGHYESIGQISPEAEDNDSFNYEFALSPATRDKIFEYSAKAGYFQKDVDSHRKNMAFTGKKTLSYKDSRRASEATFNYSPDSTVQELTNLFQGLSATLEFGHRLEYFRRYQKLALDEEMKRMQESVRTSPPVEIEAIAPILQQLIADTGVTNITRARAQRLLDQSGR
jgi:hypothetical protein